MGSAVALQPNGKIVVAGLSDVAPQHDFAVLRLQDDGSADLSYGNNGFVLVDVDFGSVDAGYAMVIDAAGCAVVAGSAGPWAGIARLLGDEQTSGALDDWELQRSLRLEDPWPNPMRQQTSISFHLAKAAALELAIFDVRGRLIRRLASGERFEVGRHTILWDGRNSAGRSVANGVYLVSARRGSDREMRRITLLR
jgi:hypothetical protein